MFNELKKHGVTEKTPENILLGAGTLHKNLKFGYYLLKSAPDDWNSGYSHYYTRTGEAPNYTYTPRTQAVEDFVENTFYYKGWNFEQSLIGATSGGNKLTITPEIKTVEVDGALVKVKGLDFKQGEVAKLETNLVEITPDLLKMTVIGQSNSQQEVDGYAEIVSKADIATGDYYDNIGFIGHKTNGDPIIVILDNALCTTGFDGEAKNKDNTVIKVTFECYQEVTGDLMKLPYHIYYPAQG